MKSVFKIKRGDERLFNKHIAGAGVSIQTDRRSAQDGILYQVEGDPDAVGRFMRTIDWLNPIMLVEEQEADEAPEALSLDALPEALEVLDQSVTKLRKALATGDYDLYLEALLEAEQAGKTRKTAVDAIQDRIDA